MPKFEKFPTKSPESKMGNAIELPNAFENLEEFDINSLNIGETLIFITKGSIYTLERRPDGFYIAGNPKYCPEPTKADIIGSTLGGSSIKIGSIIVGGYLEFTTENHKEPITTSQIERLRKIV